MAAKKVSRSWDKPLCLIETDSKGQLRVNDRTSSLLSQVPAPIVVVGIAGLYRTGKSYLLNLLAERTRGFSLGSSIKSCTKGIWVWCVEHPEKPGWTLLLMDTEGLGDPEKGDHNHDIWIFTLTVLLSSTVVYNSKGTIDNDALEKLYFVTEISDHIKIKTTGKHEEADYDKVFPSFVWAVRDFTLDLTLEGRAITSDEYLENALRLRRGAGKRIQNYNLPRECVRSYFRSRSCFTFPIPVTEREYMRHLETVTERQLSPAFVQASQSFRHYIYTEAKPKMVHDSAVTGGMLAGLANTYTQAIRSGVVPCVESAVKTTAKIQNTRAVDEAVAFYKSRMESVTLPTESVADVSAVHEKSYKRAVAIFMGKSAFDDDLTFQKKLMQILNDFYAKISQENERASVQKCNAILTELSQQLNAKVAAGVYMVPGGYMTYKKDLAAVAQRYNNTPGKGIKSAQTLHKFLKSKRTESDMIMASDKNITKEQTKQEEARQRAEESDRKRHIAEENRKRLEQEEIDRDRSRQENIVQLQQKIEERLKNMEAEYEQILDSRLNEQRRLIEEGSEERARKMEKEIEDLMNEIDAKEKKTKILDILKTIGTITVAVIKIAASVYGGVQFLF